MNGIIVIDKPINMTSHDVVSQVRKTLKTKKVGHLGTLDPLASGVLVVCVGDATKLAQFIENVEKTYLATICIGKTTSTLDSESDFTEIKKVEKIDENTYIIDAGISIYELEKILNIRIPDGEYDTVSGYLIEQLGRLPKKNEKAVIETEDATYKIEKFEDNRIIKIKACKNNNHIEEEK